MNNITGYQYGVLGMGVIALATVTFMTSGQFTTDDSSTSIKNPPHSVIEKNPAVESTSEADLFRGNSVKPSEQESTVLDTDALLNPKIRILYENGELLDSVKKELYAEVSSGHGQRYLRETELYRTNDEHFPLVLRLKILEQHEDDTLRPVFDQSVMGGHFLIRINEGVNFEELNNYALAQNTVLDQSDLPEGVYRVVLGNQHNADVLLNAIENFDHSGYVEYADVDEITSL